LELKHPHAFAWFQQSFIMATAAQLPLHLLYERDETAWLDAMSELAAQRRLDELDWLVVRRPPRTTSGGADAA
jgi:hypothetical protein